MITVEYLRYFNLVSICMSVGFVSALAVRHRYQIPAYVYGLALSYGLFAVGSAVEIELALRSDAPFTWRTVVITTGAVAGVATAVMAWLHKDEGQ